MHASQARHAPCRFRGAELRAEKCPSCSGDVRVKVLGCALHGECTISRTVGELACCAACPDYQAAEPLETSRAD